MINIEKKYDLLKNIKSPFVSMGGYFLVFLFFLIFYSALLFWNSGIIFSDDHFFHYGLSMHIFEKGLGSLIHFNGIYLEKFANDNYFPISLYDVLLIPFNFIKNKFIGIKLADAIIASAGMFLVFYSFKKLKIPNAFLFTVFLCGISFFGTRMLIGRALVLIPGLILLESYLAINRKYKSLFFVSFFHVFWHSSTFFIPLFVAFVVEVARYLNSYEFEWRNFVCSALPALPMFIYAPPLLKYLILTQQLASGGNKFEGGELYKIDIFNYFTNSNVVFGMSLVGFFCAIYVYQESKKIKDNPSDARFKIYIFFLFSLLFMFGSLVISGRFSDYYYPVAVALFIFCIAYLIGDGRIYVEKKVSKVLLLSFSFYVVFSVTNFFVSSISDMVKRDVNPIRNASIWIEKKSNIGDHVYIWDWGYFPLAYFYNQKNTYSMGLEPRTLLEYSPKLYWRWYNMFGYGYYCEKQEDCEDEAGAWRENNKKLSEEDRKKVEKENAEKILDSIKNEFDAKFILANSQQGAIFEMADDKIKDQVEFKSDVNSVVMKAYELK